MIPEFERLFPNQGSSHSFQVLRNQAVSPAVVLQGGLAINDILEFSKTYLWSLPPHIPD